MRYFVMVEADADQAFESLGNLGVDLFLGTSHRKERRVEALVTMEEVGRLVDLGFRVTVLEGENRRSRAIEIISFADWLETVR